MAIAIPLLGFSDRERSVTPLFFQKQILFTIISTLSKNKTKNQCGKLKKFQDFCPRDMESCHLATARHEKLWSLNVNLFFEEPHQLTKIA